MKRITLLLLVLITTSSIYPETLDSLKAQRERLYARYSEINQPGRELSKENIQKSLVILKDMVISDTKIISKYGEYNSKMKAIDERNKSMQVDNTELNDKLTAATDRLFIMYIAGGAVVCMLVVALIFLIAYNIRYRKLKKKTKDYAEMLRTCDNDRNKLQQMNETLIQKDKELTNKDEQLSSSQKENLAAKKFIKEIQSKLDDMQKQPPPPIIPPTIAQSHDFDMNLAKLEKLSKMKDMGIVTEEEFYTFRKKFLGEL